LRVNERLEGTAPQEILRWAADVYGKGLTLSVSFGNPEGMVLLDMLSCITDEARVFTLDTGILFEEALRFREEAMKRDLLPLEVVTPSHTLEEQVERYGPEFYTCAPDLDFVGCAADSAAARNCSPVHLTSRRHWIS
jgi:phosphoadenosine phosphosulfate reductase